MEFIYKLMIVFAIVAVIATFAYIIDAVRKVGKIQRQKNMSFKQSMDLINLPIITFLNNGKKLNFLLDTGATNSSINDKVLSYIKYKNTDISQSYYGIEGKLKESKYISMQITYEEDIFSDNFQVVDLNLAFDNIKQEYGITLHGLIGSTFFQKYKYMIDFDKLIAYAQV